MEPPGTDTFVRPLAPHKGPRVGAGGPRASHRGQPCGPVLLGPLAAPSLACLQGRGWRAAQRSGCLTFFLSSFMLSPPSAAAQGQLKAQPRCTQGEGMETRRLSFTEVLLRGPRLAGGVWLPVVAGGAARWILSGEWPAFLLQSPGPSPCASPNPWTA